MRVSAANVFNFRKCLLLTFILYAMLALAFLRFLITRTSPGAEMRKFRIARAISSVREVADRNRELLNSIRPQVIIILAAFRTGSTFLGRVLSAHPAIYYHYEPLVYFGLTEDRLEGRKEVSSAVETLKSLASCEYLKAGRLLRTDFIHHFLHFNPKIRSQCIKLEKQCLELDFIQKSCKLFPVQLFKLVRFHGKAVKELIKTFPAAQILYLFRDPRAIYSSRIEKKIIWCWGRCRNSSDLCAQLQDDLAQARELQVTLRESNSNKVHVIKYEQLALGPVKTFQRIFKSLGLDWHDDVEQYLNSHTSAKVEDDDDPYSTLRNSSAHVETWKRLLDSETVLRIEKECKNLMTELNYPVTLVGS